MEYNSDIGGRMAETALPHRLGGCHLIKNEEFFFSNRE